MIADCTPFLCGRVFKLRNWTWFTLYLHQKVNLFHNTESVWQWKVYFFSFINLIRKSVFYSPIIIMALMFLICLRWFIPQGPFPCIFSISFHFLSFKTISIKILANWVKKQVRKKCFLRDKDNFFNWVYIITYKKSLNFIDS